MSSGNVLRNRDFARLFFAGAASVSGFSIGQVAINYLVFSKTHSSIDLAGVGVAFTLGLVSLSVFGGTLADRQDRRVLMIVCDAVRAVSLAIVAMTLLLLGFSYWVVVPASFVLGAFSAIFQPAERAMIPSILQKEQLANANGLVQLTGSLAGALSNALGGALVVVVGAVLAIGLNSVTFLISGLLIATVTTRRPSSGEGIPGDPGKAANKKGFLDDTREGLRYLIGFRGLLMLTISASFVNLFYAMIFPFAVIYTTQVLHGDATTYGIFLGMFSLGAAPGSLLVGRVGAVRKAGLAWCLSGVAGGACLLSLVVVPFVIAAFAAAFLFGVFLGFAVTTWLSIVQIIVPNEMQGRYFGIDTLGSFAILPVGQIVGGLAIASIGLTWTYGLAAGGMLLSSLAFLGYPELRRMGYAKPKSHEVGV